MNRKEMGTLFRATRKHLGLSQEQFCKKLGCSQGRMSKIEKGRLEPGAGDLWWLIENVLDLDLTVEFTSALPKESQ